MSGGQCHLTILNDFPFLLSELTEYTCELINAVKLDKYRRKHIGENIQRLNVDFSHGIALKICKTHLDFDIILLCVYISPQRDHRVIIMKTQMAYSY